MGILCYTVLHYIFYICRTKYKKYWVENELINIHLYLNIK